MKRAFIVLLVISSALLVAYFVDREYQRRRLYPYYSRNGGAEAKRDLANGIIRLKEYGYAFPQYYVYKKVIHERLNVEMEEIGGCCVFHSTVEYAEAYNAVVRRFIEKKYGAGIWEEIDKETEKIVKEANQALEPTTPAVTIRAGARLAPAGVVAHL